MPKLLLLVPCETVVVGQNDVASLINLLSELQIGNLPEIVPPDAAIPYKWTIFTEWFFTEEEGRLNWAQRLRLLTPHGEATMLQHVAELPPSLGKPRHRIIAQLNFFPILPEAEYQIEVSLKEIEAREWGVVNTYPLRIKRTLIVNSPISVIPGA